MKKMTPEDAARLRRPHPPRPRRPRPVRAATASSTRRSIAARRCSTRTTTTSRTARARYTYGTQGHADDGGAGDGLDASSPARPARSLAPSGPRRHHGGAAVLPQGRRPPARHRQRLPADPHVLRRHAEALRRRDHLLRSADRRRASSALMRPNTTAVLHGGAGLADLRDAGHPGHRRGRAPARRRACSWTTPGRRRCSSRRTSAASTSPSRPARNICRGDSDLLLGLVSANERCWPRCARPTTPWPSAPARRTSSWRCAACAPWQLRLKEHEKQALDAGRAGCESGPEVQQVLHPALPERSRPRHLEARLHGLVRPVLDRS